MPTPAPRPVQVLVAEDNAQVRTVIVMHLTRLGYEVVPVGDGLSALDHLAERRPDAIILDWVMPGLPGAEVCERVKMDPSTEDLPVIMLTGRSAQRDIEAGFAYGADEYLTKPFDVAELAAVLARLLAE